jgi:predicted nucleic acid-binding Zn ribbon protein
MPTYVYKFIDSGETIEVVQSFDEPTLTEATHPISGELSAVKKVFLPVGVTFKGNGFYRTDNRNGSSKRAGSSEASTAGAAGESSSSSSKSTASSDGTTTTTATPLPSKTSSGTDSSS